MVRSQSLKSPMSTVQTPRVLFLSCLLLLGASATEGQEIKDVPSPDSGSTTFQNLPLDPASRSSLEKAIRTRDYNRAETLLLEEIKRNPKSSQLLTLLGGIFFQDRQYLNAASAIKKAEAIAPLQDHARFTLAMAYIVLNHRDWARPELQKLAQADPRNALYPYWLSRLDYDDQQYAAAIVKLQKTLELNPKFIRAYDNLGLCHEAVGKYEEAIQSYQEAIRLNRERRLNSPWPPLNLGALMVKLGRLDEAGLYLRESLSFDAKIAKAHYELGVLLEKQRKDDDAIEELNQAISLIRLILSPTMP